MKLHESCLCGATIDLSGRWYHVVNEAASFRSTHAACRGEVKDAPPVGSPEAMRMWRRRFAEKD